MARILTLDEAQSLPKGQLKDWAYCALDCTGTREVFDYLHPLLNPLQKRTYAFERALQAPALSMMLRGVNVDVPLRKEMVKELKRELKKDERTIAKMPAIVEVWDGTDLETGLCMHSTRKDGRHTWEKGVPDGPERHCVSCGASRVKPVPFSANSETQQKHLFYDLFGIKPLTNKSGKVSTDGDTLDRIAKKHPKLKEIVDAIQAITDKVKQLGSLQARLSDNGRYYSSFNVGAAWTGRFSSSKNPFGLGGNLQNVAPRHRRVFGADVGKDIGYADYMQGESNIVAHLSGDTKYIEAHKLGDVHTYATRLIWPELLWTGDLKRDKKIAKQLPPWDPVEGHDYRFQAKRMQHGANYGLTPYGISKIEHIPLPQAKQAFARYMTEFEGIPAWQKWVYKEVADKHALVNPLGRSARLIGRPWDDHTKRQGLAFLPQSTLADIEDIAMWLIWKELEEQGVELLAQVHDALLHQYPREMMYLEKALLDLMAIPVPVRDIYGVERLMTIGVEAAVGRNWGHYSPDNPYGVKEI